VWHLGAARVAALIVASAWWCTPAYAQPYPAKTVRLIVPFAPGGGVDFTARILAQKLSDAWGQQAVVDNRPGAGGIIGTELVAKSPPDGYTLLMGSIGSVSINPGLYRKLPYDPVKDFAPVTQIGFVPNIVVVHPSLPVKSIRELIALARANPGALVYGTGGSGTSNHLSGELFKTMARIDIRHVPYKVGAQATSDLIGGQLSVMFDNFPTSLPHVRAGKLRALAVTSAVRSGAAPDVPTVAESGLPGYEIIGWVGVLAPAATAKEMLNKLYADIAKALTLADLKEKFANLGAEAGSSTPEQFAAFIQSEIAKWGKVIRDAGIEPN
jgi:tripartite-type tricarboxylate transporter receptor subunit TctC